MTEQRDYGEFEALDAWWRAANYLSVGQIYLLGNPLLSEPLRAEHVKPRQPDPSRRPARPGSAACPHRSSHESACGTYFSRIPIALIL